MRRYFLLVNGKNELCPYLFSHSHKSEYLGDEVDENFDSDFVQQRPV
jgi:hypothetical protein